MTERPLRATVSQKAALFDPEGRLLVLRRPDGVWEFPGGRLGAEEAPLVGLRREVYEETGLSVRVGAPVFTAAWRNDADEGRFAVVYRCETDETDVELSEEHVDGRWVTVAEARDLLTDRRVTALAQARTGTVPVEDGWLDAAPVDAIADGDGTQDDEDAAGESDSGAGTGAGTSEPAPDRADGDEDGDGPSRGNTIAEPTGADPSRRDRPDRPRTDRSDRSGGSEGT
jgi:8-oxo-dGTP pyrophosphatase MutT (NUDIX family)